MNIKLLNVLILFFHLSLFIFACSDTSLIDYVPRNEEEEKIISLLIRYQEARSKFDLENYLACLHEKGVFNYASRVMLSKNELSEALPIFWLQLQKGSRLFFPMCRENLSGNYFVHFKLVNPIIVIDQNTASATLTYVNSGWRLGHYILMKKENNRWLIYMLDWKTG